MRTPRFLFLLSLSVLLGGAADAQNAPATPASDDNPPYHPPPATNLPHVVNVPQPEQPTPSDSSGPSAASASSENLDPAKVAEYQKRFQHGYDLEQEGKFTDALAVFEGIIAEQPDAKRSLLEAGRISFQLGDLAKANEYLSKLHQIVPDFPEAIELLIQINQALKHDVKVELLCRDFTELRKSGKIPQLSQSLCFVRERFKQGDDNVVVSQFFDYAQDPNTVWMAEVYSPEGTLKRRLLLNYDDAATKALRQKDAKYGTTQVFTWMEHLIKEGKVTAINAYLQIFALPDYEKFRSAMLVILADPPKPIYSAPVDGTDH